MKRIYTKFVLDGAFVALLWFLLGEYTISIYFKQFSIIDLLVFLLVISFSIISFIVTLRKIDSNKQVFKGIGIGLAGFACTFMFVFFSMICFPVNIFPIRELGNADGFLVAFVQGLYLLCNLVARLALIVFYVIKHRKRIN